MKASAKCNSKTCSTFVCSFTLSRFPHSDPPGIGWFQTSGAGDITRNSPQTLRVFLSRVWLRYV